jgi:hypothetical protein
MVNKKDPGSLFPGGPGGGTEAEQPGNSAISWEARALEQVRPHVRRLSGPGSVQAGWETETITRLEDYFDHDEV